MTSRVRPVVLKITEPSLPAGKKTPAKVQSAWARKALGMALSEAGLRLEKDLSFDTMGAPIPQNQVYWSLTHKPLWVGAVVWKGHAIGLDIEKVEKRRNQRTYDYVGDNKEWNLMGEKNIENFFRLWTAKEAALKAIGTGLRELSSCRLTSVQPRSGDSASLILRCQDYDWSIQQYFWEDHIASVTNHGEHVDWIIRARY